MRAVSGGMSGLASAAAGVVFGLVLIYTVAVYRQPRPGWSPVKYLTLSLLVLLQVEHLHSKHPPPPAARCCTIRSESVLTK